MVILNAVNNYCKKLNKLVTKNVVEKKHVPLTFFSFLSKGTLDVVRK